MLIGVVLLDRSSRAGNADHKNRDKGHSDNNNGKHNGFIAELCIEVRSSSLDVTDNGSGD